MFVSKNKNSLYGTVAEQHACAEEKHFRVKKSILRGDWMAQTMGKGMEAAMKSLALWNSPWSVEMETNF